MECKCRTNDNRKWNDTIPKTFSFNKKVTTLLQVSRVPLQNSTGITAWTTFTANIFVQFQLYRQTLCMKASAKLSRMARFCIVFKRHFTKLSYRHDVFLISSGILKKVWEIFSRATSSSWMCCIIVVLFELSLHVTDLTSYFKMSHKGPVDSVRTSISEVLRQALVTRAQQIFFSSLFLVSYKRKHSVSFAVRPSLSQNVECFHVF